jgi:hypothetical protein
VEAHDLRLIAKSLEKSLKEGTLLLEEGNLVKPPQIVAFENHVHSLRASPLFNLSLASKELFHSNFLAWLCEKYPNLAGPLFARFTKAPSASCDPLKVHREQRNIDLTIEFPNGELLIVENKVKSIASLEQLRKYSGQARDKKRTSFLLLSLIRPAFIPPNDALVWVDEIPWHFLCYSDLVCQLEPAIVSISTINRYHGELVSDYLGFVRNLVGIAAHVSVDWRNEEANFFINHEHQLLREIRLYDLMDKMRYAQLAQRIEEVLKAEGCHVLAKKEFKAMDATAGVFMVDSSLHHGEALCEFSYLARGGENRLELGVMFQGNQIDVGVFGSRDSAKRVAEALMSPKASGQVWFDLARIPGDGPEMPEKKSFNQYSGKDGVMFYRYRRIAQSSPKGLVDILVSYARSIRDAEDTIQKQIGAVGEAG